MTIGLSNQGFDLDLAGGKAREDAFKETILRARIEHKSDSKFRTTNNFFLEYRQPSGLSGIFATEADFWAVETDVRAWSLIETSMLRMLARRAYKDGRIKMGGDYNNYHGLLIPSGWLQTPSVYVNAPLTDVPIDQWRSDGAVERAVQLALGLK